MKSSLILLLAFVLTNCVNSTQTYRLANGRVILGESSNGVFIPKDTKEKDIISLTARYKGDSVYISSEYQNNKMGVEYLFSNENSSDDSLTINIQHFNDRLPIAFLMILFYDQKNTLIDKLSFLESPSKKVKQTIAISYFQLEYLLGKSDIFPLEVNHNTLTIFFDYLSPLEMDRYTEIDTTLKRK